MNAEVLRLIDAERDRQERLITEGRIPWNCADPAIDDDRKLAVLTEEIGEVAKAILWIRDPDAFDLDLRTLELRDELVQVAAVSVAWLEALDARGLL
jgi:NTP pyrophosphatase (non-canonical NTP hydrolase)